MCGFEIGEIVKHEMGDDALYKISRIEMGEYGQVKIYTNEKDGREYSCWSYIDRWIKIEPRQLLFGFMYKE